jgi:hypothetical protein
VSSLGSSFSSWGFSSSSSSQIDATLLDLKFGGIVWNRTKIVSSEMSCVNSSVLENILVQTIRIDANDFSVGKASLYLRKKLGDSPTPFSLRLRVYEADVNGYPLLLIGSATAISTDIVETGWHTFLLNIPQRPTPVSRQISFVLVQEGGDDNNYVSWFYSPITETNGGSFWSNNGGAIWHLHSHTIRSLVVMDNFDVFEEAYEDSGLRILKSSPAVLSAVTKSGNSYLAEGEFDGTRLDTPSQKVTLNNDKLIASIVVDSSGSMGWNDRAKRRVDAVRALIKRIQDNFPGQKLFDIIQIGAGKVENPLGIQGSPQYDTTKVDLRNPSGTVLNADGSVPSITDRILAFGFKNLQPGHKYAISAIGTDIKELDSGEGAVDPLLMISSPINYQSVGPNGNLITISNQNEGPGAEKGAGLGVQAVVAEVPLSGTYQIRRPFAASQLFVTELSSDVSFGDTLINVNLPLTQKTSVDLVGIDKVSSEHSVVSVLGNSATISPGAKFNIGQASSADGGFVQISSVNGAQNLSSSTLGILLVKDAEASQDITFYLQTVGGGMLEYRFRAVKEWTSRNWVWVDRPIALSADATDSSTGKRATGDAEFFIDAPPPASDQFKPPTALGFAPPRPLEAGTVTITDLPSTEGIAVGDETTIVASNGTRLDGYSVEEVDTIALSVTIFPPIYVAVEMASIEFSKPAEPATEEGEVALKLFAVDETPMTLQRACSSPPLPTDPPPVDPDETDPDAYNEDDTRWRVGTFDVPAMFDEAPGSEQAVATIRVLPVTEDKLSTPSDMDSKVAAISGSGALTDQERAQIEALQDSYNELVVAVPSIETTAVPTESTEIESPVVPTDYVLSPKKVEIGQKAQLVSTTDSMKEENWGSGNYSFDPSKPTSPAPYASVLTKTYSVYTQLTIKDDSGNVKAQYVLPVQTADFVAPVQIFSQTEPGKTITFSDCCCTDVLGDKNRYSETVPGVYAKSGKSVRIDYVVYNRGSLLPTGTMKVKIYDAHRTRKQVESDPASVTPDLDNEVCRGQATCDPSCEDPRYNILDEQYQDFYREKDGKDYFGYSESQSQYRLAEALYLDGYVEGGLEISVVDGKASLTVSDPDLIAKLLIVAQVQTPDAETLYTARHDTVFFFSPIKLSLGAPSRPMSGLDQPPVEISAYVSYFGEPVVDDVEVNFKSSQHHRNLPGTSGLYAADDPTVTSLQSLARQLGGSAETALNDSISSLIATRGVWPPTPIRPSVSKTVEGRAGGCLLGPHDTVIMVINKLGEEVGDKESITASIVYQGFSVTQSAQVEWIGGTSSGDRIFAALYKPLVNEPLEEATLYADGWEYLMLVVDIPASINWGFFPDDNGLWQHLVSGEITNRTTDVCPQPGDEKSGGRPCGYPSHSSGPMTFSCERPADPFNNNFFYGETADSGPAVGWGSTKISGAFSPTGVVTPETPCPPTRCQKITIHTTGKTIFGETLYLTGCPSLDPGSCQEISESGDVKDVVPRVMWKEPLEAEVYLNGVSVSDQAPITRDGISYTDVEVEVTFSGKPLPMVAFEHNVRGKDGNPIPMPTITCEIYYLQETRDSSGNVIAQTKKADPSLRLSEFNPVVAVQRTTVTSDHYHSCQVDENGVGETLKTYTKGTVSEIPNHTHTVGSVSPYVVDEGFDTVPGVHSHVIRSVALTRMYPISNGGDTVCLDITVKYDASNPVIDRPPVTYSFCSPAPETQATLETWTLDLLAPVKSNTREDTTNGYSGFSVQARLTKEVGGVRQAIPDGHRINFSLKAYLPKVSGTDTSIPTFQVDESGQLVSSERSFSIVEVTASCQTPSGLLSQTKKIDIVSALEWIPAVTALVSEPTSDSVYLESAIAALPKTVGGSQIYDAVTMAASRLIEWQSKNPEWADAAKGIFLVSDCDEQNSERTIDQAINRANAVGGSGYTPIVVYQFAGDHLLDTVVGNRFSQGTGGKVFNIPLGTTVLDTEDVVYDSLATTYSKFNNGSYVNVVDLGQSYLTKTVTFAITVPSGAKATVSFRFSDDRNVWGAWSSPQTALGTIPLPRGIKRYMQYEIRMTGSDIFLSPELASVTEEYMRTGKDLVFFQPISLDVSQDDFVGEAIISHEAEIPELSSVSYGIVQADTVEPSDYSSAMFPKMVAGRKGVILSRFNELTTTIDHRTFKLVNGGWPKKSAIEVCLMQPGGKEGAVVDSGLYFADSVAGTITFASAQSGTVFASVSLAPELRMVCEIVNHDSDATIIHHIGLSYNVTRRVRRDSSGTIVRQPIAVILDESSSSSSLSSSSVL